jgi:hypothetical protein
MTLERRTPFLQVGERTRRFRLIACDVLCRELNACAAVCPPVIDTHFLPKGLHDLGAGPMSAALQEAIDQTEPTRYDAILLGYGLCSNGVLGLRGPVPIVVPRAHDCISLLLGSRAMYQAYFEKNPGTYFLSPGWIERGSERSTNPESIPSQLGIDRTYQEYVEEYGEDNARYLMETLGGWLRNYRKLAYIDTHTGDFEAYKDIARRQADEQGWDYEDLDGSIGLMLRLLAGAWDEDEFLVVPPGQTIAAAHDDRIVKTVGINTV